MSSANSIPPPNELYTYFNECRLQEKFCDIFLKVENRLFPCHRVVLWSASEYFRNMFSGEYNEVENKKVELKGVSAVELDFLLNHMYGSLVHFDGVDSAYRLLKISHQLCLQRVEDSCVRYLIDNIDAYTVPLGTVMNIYNSACRLGKTELEKKFVECVAADFSDAVKFENFICISGDTLLKVIGHPKMEKNVPEAVDFLVNWVKFHPNVDRELLSSLLDVLIVENGVKEWFLKTLLPTGAESVLSSSTSGKANDGSSSSREQPLDRNVIDEHEVSSNQKMPFILFLTEEVRIGPVFIAGEVTTGPEFLTKSYIRPYELSHQRKGKLLHYGRPENISPVFLKSFLVNEAHFMISACKEDSAFHYTPFMYQEFAPYKTLDRCSSYLSSGKPTATSHDTNIYLYDNNGFLVFNCKKNKWFQLPSKNGLVNVFNPNLLSYNNSLYLIGGNLPITPNPYSTASNTRERAQMSGKFFQHYDVRVGVWMQLPKMTYSCFQSASCVLDDVLYVTGGDNSIHCPQGNIECFDFKACKWRKFETSMPNLKRSHHLLALNDRLWFFGGQSYYESSWTVNDRTWYWYDLKEHTWSDIFQVPPSYGNGNISQILDVMVKI